MTTFIEDQVDNNRQKQKNSQELYWNDLNQLKFLGLLTVNSFLLRTTFYPLGVIKTRLQTGDKFQKSMIEMIKKIIREEGPRRGFYRAYSVSICAVLFEPVYMTTLELTRYFCNNNKPNFISKIQWDTITNSLAAGTAALAHQTFLVPIDVTAQRVMITRACDGIRIIDIINDIYFKSGDGIKGFYKGYFLTLSTSLPFNSILWTLYWKIQLKFEKIFSSKSDYIISPLSSAISVLLTSFITQPIDVLKTRLQVSKKRISIFRTIAILHEQRGFKGFFAGFVPRALISVPSLVIMMSFYEFIKRSSKKESF